MRKDSIAGEDALQASQDETEKPIFWRLQGIPSIEEAENIKRLLIEDGNLINFTWAPSIRKSYTAFVRRSIGSKPPLKNIDENFLGITPLYAKEEDGAKDEEVVEYVKNRLFSLCSHVL